MARANTKIGDIFSANIENYKKYFQYIASDLTQLNSDVIRIFKSKYPIDASPDLSEIIKDDVAIYAHCVTKFGLKFGLWQKEGNLADVGDIKNILFKGTGDYARKVGEEPVKVSEKWYVWRINDFDFTRIGKLEGEYKKNAHIGLVINPQGIIELLKDNKYPENYPE